MTTEQSTQIHELSQKIASRYSSLPQVEAVTIAGSQTFNTFDSQSDLDLYVYIQSDIPSNLRTNIASGAKVMQIDNQFWEPGDEWIDADTNIYIDVMFRKVEWIEEQLEGILRRYQANVGYSTCFWHNILNSHALYDKRGWFHELQQTVQQPYPEELRNAIVAKNHPILRHNLSSYLHQIDLALKRQDIVSLNHRVSALLASYFDILFALNYLPHPGEKRLVRIAEERCHKKPEKMSEQISELIGSVSGNHQLVMKKANELLDGLDQLLGS